jgi:hypothetical protein
MLKAHIKMELVYIQELNSHPFLQATDLALGCIYVGLDVLQNPVNEQSCRISSKGKLDRHSTQLDISKNGLTYEEVEIS